MTNRKLHLAFLEDPRFAAHALSPAPVWLWSAAANRVLWANPVAAAIFEAASPAELTTRNFEPRHAAAVQVARLAKSLRPDGAPRLERLRGFGGSIGGALICLCSRVMVADKEAVLLVSTERAGKELPLPERATRLLRDLDLPTAVFTADGELIDAQAAARERLGSHRDLVRLGAEKVARAATTKGMAAGKTAAGKIRLIKLGAGPTFALLATFTGSPPPAPADRRENEAAASSPAAAAQPEPGAPRLPLRFVWKTDVGTHFTLASEEFIVLSGPKTAELLGRPWSEVAKSLNIDPKEQITSAMTTRETFSGVSVDWPLDGLDQSLTVEMSGLPMFDREREFTGFRGFGICRNIDQLKDVAERRRQAGAASAPTPPAESPKVVAFPSAPQQVPAPAPTARDHSAFQELARELSQRLKRSARGEKSDKAPPADMPEDTAPEAVVPSLQPVTPAPVRDVQDNRPILDRLPVGILVYRLNTLIYANRVFLDWTGYTTLDELADAGGLDSLFIENSDGARAKDKKGGRTLTISTVNGNQKPVEGRLFSVTWNGENALALMIETKSESGGKAAPAVPTDLDRENRELKAILDTATDGVLVLDRAGRVLSSNRSAQALFGYDADELAALSMTDLLVPETHRVVLQHLERLAQGQGVGSLNPGYETIGRVSQGGLAPLHITIGRIEDGEKLCAVLRDVTAWKRSEEELVDARRAAEKASIAKSEFLAKISHEIRTPLNAIIGFSEVMLDERFGPIGSERYRQYLKDIHASGGHLVSLINDLLDLSKIESGKLDLTFVSVNLNDLVQQCVAIMQQQANRERVIIRTSLPASMPQVIADARSVRQIALNLLSNSIKFTGAGGQVIISTAQTDEHQVVLRVRDTGSGMSENDLQTALEPFRQIATSARWDSSGTGLGLPITKALAEANHAEFRITSQVGDGTMVEVIFPPGRVLAQ